MMLDTNIYNAIRKCDNTYGSWCGYLRPDEIVELVRRGLVATHQHFVLEDAKEKVKKGICNPIWFYFSPTEKFLEVHRGLIFC